MPRRKRGMPSGLRPLANFQYYCANGSVGPDLPQIVAPGRIPGSTGPPPRRSSQTEPGSPSVCEPGAEAIRAMLAQLPSALEAFDDAGSVFLPPDPNADHEDDDDSFASQDTLLEDARTKHKRLARQRLEAASRDAKPVKALPMTQPIVVKQTPKKVQPPTPSPLTLDAVTKLATADVRRELEARGLRSAGPRSIAVARLRHALEPQQPTQKKSSGTGTGVFDMSRGARRRGVLHPVRETYRREQTTLSSVGGAVVDQGPGVRARV